MWERFFSLRNWKNKTPFDTSHLYRKLRNWKYKTFEVFYFFIFLSFEPINKKLNESNTSNVLSKHFSMFLYFQFLREKYLSHKQNVLFYIRTRTYVWEIDLRSWIEHGSRDLSPDQKYHMTTFGVFEMAEKNLNFENFLIIWF